MEIRPRQLAVAGAVAAAGFLGVGALTAASAQDSGDDSSSTTVEEEPGTDAESRSDEDCPHDGEGRGGPRGDRDQSGEQEEEEATAS